MKLTLGEITFKLELNGTVIHEGPIPAGVERNFGLFHYRNRTEAKARNLSLTGPWAKKFESIGFATKPPSPAVAKARRELIDERNFALEAEKLLDRAKALSPAERFKLLSDWVLPSASRPVFQFSGVLTSKDNLSTARAPDQPPGRRVILGSEFESPALMLVRTAKDLNKLDELSERVANAKDAAKPAQEAMAVLILAAQGKDAEAAPKLAELKKTVEAMAPTAPGHERFPILLAVWAALERPALVKPATDLAHAMNRNIENCIVAKQNFDDREWWFNSFRFVRAIGEVKSLGESRAFGDNDRFANWIAVSGVTPGARNGISQLPHWNYRDGVLTHYPGFGDDYLILNMPLAGNFEVSCDLKLEGWQEASIRYGGIELRLDTDRKSFKLCTHLGSDGKKVIITPPLKDLTAKTYQFRMAFADGTLKYFIDGQQIHSENVGPTPDPWLMIRSSAVNTAEVKNIVITGSPTVPPTIDLTSAEDFFTWRAYHGGNGNWSQRGEEMYHFGGKSQNKFYYDDDGNYYGNGGMLVKFPETAHYYQRPLAEDGAIDCEFYYSPCKCMVHPMLDRLVFLLEPNDVKLHWLTDGAWEKSGTSPTNAIDEPDCRRGPEKLPLKEKAWNRLRLQVIGDRVKLSLNGAEIYERKIESTNQRFFGLFHYSDQTEARVRNIIYEGNWPKKLPAADKLFEMK